jgi:uncharacterized membrane protein YgaE (UPF0421/DUF939 family)
MNDYKKLEMDYQNLQNEFDKLQKDFSENVIIQSMEDMKNQYNSLEKTLDFYKKSTVPIIRYSKIEERYNNLIEVLTCIGVLVRHSNNTIEKIKIDKKHITKLEMEYIVLNDIIVDNLNTN